MRKFRWMDVGLLHNHDLDEIWHIDRWRTASSASHPAGMSSLIDFITISTLRLWSRFFMFIHFATLCAHIIIKLVWQVSVKRHLSSIKAYISTNIVLSFIQLSEHNVFHLCKALFSLKFYRFMYFLSILRKSKKMNEVTNKINNKWI